MKKKKRGNGGELIRMMLVNRSPPPAKPEGGGTGIPPRHTAVGLEPAGPSPEMLSSLAEEPLVTCQENIRRE